MSGFPEGSFGVNLLDDLILIEELKVSSDDEEE
jgi:hypothetical protein